MARGRWMQRFARWHIWLGWLAGVPLLLWTASGVVMVLKPIEDVRGNGLRIERSKEPLRGNPRPVPFQSDGAHYPVELRSFVQRGHPVTLVTFADGSFSRVDAATGAPMGPMEEKEARAALASDIKSGAQVVRLQAFPPSEPPLDLRKPVSVWQATLADGTHVYFNRQTGEIEAVRTRWWRFYDFMWGLHIMDLQGREDAHNPFTIAFGLLALLGSALGSVLLFRRRKARRIATDPIRGAGAK